MYWILPLICLPFVAMRPTGKWRLILGFLFSSSFFYSFILCTYRNSIGTDWDNYYRAFVTINTLPLFQSGYEPLYELVLRIASNYNFSLLLAFDFLLICIPTYTAIWRISPYPLLSLLLLYSYSLNSFGFGYRQDIAIALSFLAFLLLFNKHYLYHLTLIFALLFHWSTIIFFLAKPLFWLFKAFQAPSFLLSLLKPKKILLFVLLTFLLIFTYPLSEAPILKYGIYLDDGVSFREGSAPLVGLLTRLVNAIFISFVFFSYQASKFLPTNKNFVEVLERCSFSLWIGVAIYLFSLPFGEVVERLSRYYDIVSIVAVPLALSFITASFIRTFLFISFIFIAVLRILVYFLVLAPVEFVPYSSYLF